MSNKEKVEHDYRLHGDMQGIDSIKVATQFAKDFAEQFSGLANGKSKEDKLNIRGLL